MNSFKKKQSKPKFSIPESWKRKLPWAGAILLVVALLVYGGVSWANWAKRHPAPPKEGAKPVEIAKFITSDSFSKLRLSQQEEYLKKMMPAPGTDPREAMKDMDDKTRRALFERMRDVREAQMKKTAREYFALPKEQRAAWMAIHVAEQDKRREEMRARFQQMRQQRQGGNAGGPPPGGGPGGPPPF